MDDSSLQSALEQLAAQIEELNDTCRDCDAVTADRLENSKTLKGMLGKISSLMTKTIKATRKLADKGARRNTRRPATFSKKDSSKQRFSSRLTIKRSIKIISRGIVYTVRKPVVALSRIDVNEYLKRKKTLSEESTDVPKRRFSLPRAAKSRASHNLSNCEITTRKTRQSRSKNFESIKEVSIEPQNVSLENDLESVNTTGMIASKRCNENFSNKIGNDTNKNISKSSREKHNKDDNQELAKSDDLKNISGDKSNDTSGNHHEIFDLDKSSQLSNMQQTIGHTVDEELKTALESANLQYYMDEAGIINVMVSSECNEEWMLEASRIPLDHNGTLETPITDMPQSEVIIGNDNPNTICEYTQQISSIPLGFDVNLDNEDTTLEQLSEFIHVKETPSKRKTKSKKRTKSINDVSNHKDKPLVERKKRKIMPLLEPKPLPEKVQPTRQSRRDRKSKNYDPDFFYSWDDFYDTNERKSKH